MVTEEQLQHGFDLEDARVKEEWAILKVRDELKRQKDKWGVQDHNATMWATIIGEQYGEMCKEVNEFMFTPTPEIEVKMFEEAVQTAAYCIAMCGNMLRNSKAVQDHANFYIC